MPFKRKLKEVKPVEVFKDTWTWGQEEDEMLEGFKSSSNPNVKKLADLVFLARSINDERTKTRSAAAYLCNMAIRLLSMKRVLKNTGSIYLHCDPTMSHYLKLSLDLIFGRKNFRDEIAWHYPSMSKRLSGFPKKHDTIFRYTMSDNYIFNYKNILIPYAKSTVNRSKYGGAGFKRKEGYSNYLVREGKIPDSVWNIPHIKSKNEHLGYPTQKPLKLLERIIKASSNEGDLVLDPFCGCGTAVHAAEDQKRNWIGIDISKFSTGLISERICNNFPKLQSSDIRIFNVPDNLQSARNLAKQDPFEFEKWVCGEIGAHGMFREPGRKGSDGGVDGIIDFGLFKGLNKLSKGYAIVQVKGGKVTPDSVRALYQTVKFFGATAGVFVCFNEYMNTVENNRNKDTYNDLTGIYPLIQGFSVEDLLAKKKPNLPPLVIRENALFT